MSSDAVTSWLRLQRYETQYNNPPVVRACNRTGKDRLAINSTTSSNISSPTGNATLLNLSGEPQHHRIFWKEETTAASVWEGAHQALGPSKLRETDENSKTDENFKSDGEKTNDQRNGQQIFRQYRRQNSAAALLAEVSTNSNLRRLSDLLNEGTIDCACPTTLAEALENSNPAVVEMILHRGQRNLHYGGGVFRSLGGAGSYDTSPQCTFPLHACCLTGSPEIVSVLLTFIDKSFSNRVERRLMVNARDSNGRTALHLASWSPQLHCPGRRHDIMRDLVAHDADVNVRDQRGRTPLHEACFSVDRIAVKILLKAGANPLQEDDENRTPLQTVARNKPKSRHLLDGEIRKHVPLASYRHMYAKIIARSYVTRFMHRFELKCDQCGARSLTKCRDQKLREFPTWLYKHKRWPKSVEGKQQQVRPSAVEMASLGTASNV